MTNLAMKYKLPAYVKVNRDVGGNMPEEIKRFEQRHKWCTKYNELAVVHLIVKEAPKMQKERKMLALALGLKEGGNGFPDQTEGLDDVTAATVSWITMSGESPLEYLAGVYRDSNAEIKTSDRIAAARALMEYVHRKIPVKQEVKTEATQVIDVSMLKNLTPKDIS